MMLRSAWLKGETIMTKYQMIYDCRDQMSAKQAAAHLQDADFRAWLDANDLRW